MTRCESYPLCSGTIYFPTAPCFGTIYFPTTPCIIYSYEKVSYRLVQ